MLIAMLMFLIAC